MKQEYSVTRRPQRSPVHPGEILKEAVLPALRLSVSEAARSGHPEPWEMVPGIMPVFQ